ncbi:MAG TPA: polyphenol oxidase family protein [Solirubrobacteraceae bacterium]|jgi:YfiH family protein|nr:polyphenol oxidase family protein [Solirubrobacteraceae bacterium]
MRFDLPRAGHVVFTTRAQDSLSSVGGTDAEYGSGARDRLCRQLGLRGLARGYQVHGATVLRVRGHGQILAPVDVEADGQATTLHGVGVMVLTADCLPIALGTDDAVAMVHAGWRGLAAGVLEEGVCALRELGDEGDIHAVIGPGAGPCCYEVGEEVHAAFGGAHRTGRHIDLKALARDRLHTAGVVEVQDVEMCTICDERFFSHRREHALSGRQAGVAWLC